jgi:tetratricopeptide (TPR) repeat protein
MTLIRAFVGHSFTEEDDPVVRTFLEYFNEVQKMNLGFSWDHARAAEAKDLSEKVLMKIQDKNLFIGICTKKERVIADSELRPPFWPRKQLAADENSFEWKTSDWISQEIGLAIGRDMELMILLERGVRRPGGLQGNHEYIVFDRNAPEKTFTQILQTIRSLIPRPLLSSAGQIKPEIELEQNEPTADEGVDWLEPKGNWSRKQFEFAYMHALVDENEARTGKIDKVFLASEHAQQSMAIESWEAGKERLRIAFGKGGKLSNLEHLAKTYNQNSDVHRYLAKAYRDYEQYAKAADHFQHAAEVADTDKRKLDCYGEAIISLIDSNEIGKARELTQQVKVFARNVENGEMSLIGILRQAAEKQKNNDAVFGLTEFLLQHTPDDVDSRFGLAYGYSQAALEDVALLHYLRIHHPDRSSAAWNNLGVQFEHFNLDASAVGAYRKAEELGETLAMSNLAYKFIKLGFLDEASEICNKALMLENCDKRVNQAITRVKELPDEESKKQEEVTRNALALSEFFIEFGRALTQNQCPNHDGLWRGPDCELQISISNEKFVAVGEYERKNTGLLRGLGMTQSAPTASRFRVNIEGAIEGGSVKGTIRREELGRATSALTIFGNPDVGSSVLLVISESMRQINVCELGKPDSRKFYQLSRID